MERDEGESAFARLGRRGLVSRLHDQLNELLEARDQMEELLNVIVDISSDLDLDATLNRVITAAMALTGARYGALGIRAADGTIARFFHVGTDSETVARIGAQPVGKGLLGLPLNQQDPVRLDDLTSHPDAVGFPEHHPEMRAFLGVPITIRGTVFGSLYLTHDESSRVFGESDEIAARALASAAAVAIDNAKLFEQMRATAKWMEASREITTALLSGVDPELRPLQLVVDRARELTEAEQAIVLVPIDSDLPIEEVDALCVSAASGLHTAEVVGQRVPVDGSTTGGVFRSGIPVITDSFRYPIPAFTDVGERPAIVMPLRTNDTTAGVIAVARHSDQPPFDTGHLELMSDFADHAAIALTLGASRERLADLKLLEDRERIARDLHDHVIQRLFAAGINLQGTLARVRSPDITQRLNHTLDDLQGTIEDIRATVFELQRPSGHMGFRQRVQQAVADLTGDGDIATTLRLLGPLAAVDAGLAEHAEAVIIEAISNSVRHSGGRRLIVEVNVTNDLTIDVSDDGCGIHPDNKRRSGLANLRRRAEQLQGHCDIDSTVGAGTRVHWCVPLSPT